MKITIGMKLTMGFMALLIMIMVMGVVAYRYLIDMKNDADKILLYSHKYEMVNGLKEMLSVFLNLNDNLISGHLRNQDYYETLIKDLEKRISYVGKLRLNENESNRIKIIDKNFSLIREKTEKLLKSSEMGDNPAADELRGEINMAKWVLVNNISDLYDEAWRFLDESVVMAHETERKGWLAIRVISSVAIILGLGIGIMLTRAIAKPIRSLTSAINVIAKGDLNQSIQVRSRDEIGELVNSFNKMTKDLMESRERAEQKARELREAQTRLVQSEKLSSMGQVAAGIGHELRNTLGVIKNAVYYLKGKIGEADSKLGRHITIIEREIVSSDRIVNDLLHFSRPIEMTLRLMDINRIIDEALSAIEIPPDIKIIKELEGKLPDVMIDGDHIRRVFINMILNACQAMPAGGELKVVSRMKDDFIHIDFTDTGVGISKDNLSRLFEPFFTTKVKGIGLGLTVSRRMIEKHQGKIEVRSELNKGTTFAIILPMGDERSMSYHHADPSEQGKIRVKANILIVDDQMGMLESMRDILEEKGYNVIIATDGWEAVKKAKDNQVDLALIDIKLPGMNGVETFKEIKKINTALPVIIMTAYAVDDLVRESIAEGAYTIIYKPFNPEGVIKTIEEIFGDRDGRISLSNG